MGVPQLYVDDFYLANERLSEFSTVKIDGIDYNVNFRTVVPGS